MSSKAIYFNPVEEGTKSYDMGGGDPWLNILNKASAGRMSPRTGWTRQAWIRACVDIRARAVSGLPWSINRGESEVWTRGQAVPPALDWLHNLSSLLYLYEASASLLGRAYVYQERVSEQGRTEGLRWLNPETIEEVYDRQTGAIGGFRRSVNGNIETLPVEDVLYLYRLDPFTEIGPPQATDGRAATEAGRVLLSMTDFLHNYFDKGMVRATLLYVHEQTSDEEIVRVSKWWDRFLSGTRNAGANKAIRTGGVEPKTFGDGLKDIGDTELTTDQRQDIAAAFRVPMFLLDSNAANLATAQEYRAEWYQQQILPSARQFASTLERQVLEPMGYSLEFHPRRMELFQRREIDKAQAVRLLTGRPVMTVNEGRGLLELPELPGEDTLPNGGLPFSEPTDTSSKRHEAQQWKRKAEAKGRDVDFVPVHLEAHDVATIKARLAQGWPMESAFEGPFHNF